MRTSSSTSCPFLLFETKSADDFDVDKEKSIQELHKIAMEEDEEWYNEFVRNVLGEEVDVDDQEVSNVIRVMDDDDDNDGVNKINMKEEKGEDIKRTIKVNEKENVVKDKVQLDESMSQSVVEENNRNDKMPTETSLKNTMQENTKQSVPNNTSASEIDSKENTMKRENTQNDKQIEKTEIKNEDNPQSTTTNNNDDDDDDNIVVQYTDMFQKLQRVPMSTLSKLGYNMEDIYILQAAVLELILEDEIPMPKGGIPSRWMVEEMNDTGGYNSEVKILKKRKKNVDQNQNPENQRPDARSDSMVEDKDVEVSSQRRRPREQGQPQRRQRQPPNQSDRSSKRQRRSDDSSTRSEKRSGQSSNTIWMDVPTFKQYLRREADLRLMILGEDWEDWVKGESEWRLNLYKKWMDVVQNGIGNDIMEDLYSVPLSERRRTRTRTSMRDDVNVRGDTRPPPTRRSVVGRTRTRESPRERSRATSTSTTTRMDRREPRQRPSSMMRQKRRTSRPLDEEEDLEI